MAKKYEYHWMWKTRFYQTWINMKSRCNNKTPHSKSYRDKWIKVLWKTFWEFRDDMYKNYLEHVEKHWEKNTSINRIDNDWNYCKDNCEWATNTTQMLNTSRNLILEKDGVKKTAKERSQELWINENTIRVRYLRWQDPLYKWYIRHKWSVMDNYKMHCELHKDKSVKYINFYLRVNRLWRSIEKAINTPNK